MKKLLCSSLLFLTVTVNCLPTVDWTKFLPAQKRAVSDGSEATGISEIPLQYSQVSQTNPLLPYLSIKPYLPAKPTFIPPLVDPQIFINKKTELLNNLLSSKQIASKPVPLSGVSDAVPNYFVGKKAALLGNLFTQNTDSSSVSDASKRAAIPLQSDPSSYDLQSFLSSLNTPAEYDDDISSDLNGITATLKPTIVPPSFWIPDKTAMVKPTIVPPNFWSPFSAGASKTISAPIGPQYFADKKTKFLNTLFDQISKKPTVTSGMEKRLIMGSPAMFGPKTFIDKKTAFLDKLFSTINAPPTDIPSQTATLLTAPTPKSTIVPPNFWFPITSADTTSNANSVVPDTSTIITKKNYFLNKLFDTLNISTANSPSPLPSEDTNDTEDSDLSDILKKLAKYISSMPKQNNSQLVTEQAQNTVMVRSISPASDPKDKIVDSIMVELSGIKNDIVSTLNQIIKQQKQATPPTPPVGKAMGKMKPGSPFGSSFGGPFGYWGASKPVPTLDPTEPLKSKLQMLSSTYDMLTNLEKQVTSAVNDASNSPVVSTVTTTPSPEDSIIMALKAQLSALTNSTNSTSSNARRSTLISESTIPDDFPRGEKLLRSIKMAVHQGYQSLPPGAEELLQAGGGGEPGKQEGGGLKLQDQIQQYVQNHKNQANRHHHNHN